MKTIKAEYTGNLRCKAEHERSKSIIVTDANKDEKNIGFTPLELFALSFLTCVATIIGYEAEALKLDISGMLMEVSFEMSKDIPKRIAQIDAVLWIPCKVSDHQKELLIRMGKNCPVRHSIHPDIKETINFHWQEESVS